jgi:hypothetical protein
MYPCFCHQQSGLLLRLDMDSGMQNWILSEENAPGLLVAHGHCGFSYENEPWNLSVLTSKDGGYTWVKVRKYVVFSIHV